MIVRLPPGKAAFLLQVKLPDDLHEAVNYGHRKIRSASLITMPYIAWAILRSELVARTYTARGARDRHEPAQLVGIVQAVQTAINVRDSHPALRGAAAMRRQIDLIPAWTEADGSFCPRPNGRRFVVLEPHTERPKRLGVEVTTWRSREPSPGDEWLCAQESHHLRFWAHAVQTLGWSPDVYGARIDQ